MPAVARMPNFACKAVVERVEIRLMMSPRCRRCGGGLRAKLNVNNSDRKLQVPRHLISRVASLSDVNGSWGVDIGHMPSTHGCVFPPPGHLFVRYLGQDRNITPVSHNRTLSSRDQQSSILVR